MHRSHISGCVRTGQIFIALVSCLPAAWAMPPQSEGALGDADVLPPAALFHSVGMTAMRELAYTPSNAALRERTVEIDFSALDPLRREIDVDVLNGKTWRITRSDYEVRGASDYTWRGTIKLTDGREGEATLSVRRGQLAGLIHTPDGDVYEIRPVAAGQYLMSELNQDRFRECAPAPAAPQLRSAAAVAEPATAYSDSGDYIDMLILYTDDARAAAGGTTAVEATVQSAIDLTNTAYANSQITTRLRLAHTEEVAYTEGGDANADLTWLTNDPAVAALRNQYGADVVSMIVNTSQYCGIGWLMTQVEAGFGSYAFNVVLRDCAAGNLTLAHETGHNQGCNHDPANSGGGTSYSYSYGHFVDGSYRTIMSYTTQCTLGCPKSPYFSNPAVSYFGTPTGIEGQRDNHQTINNTALTVANFRAAVQTLGTPGNLRVIKRARKVVNVGWQDQAAGETGFHVYRWTGTDWVLHQDFPADTTSGKITGLKPGKRYTFTLTSYSNSGESAASNQLTVKTIQ